MGVGKDIFECNRIENRGCELRFERFVKMCSKASKTELQAEILGNFLKLFEMIECDVWGISM